MVGKDDILRMIRGHGYYLHNKTHPKGLGYMDLLVAIRETSTRNHFDPELIMLQLCDKNSAASKTSLKLNTSVHLPRSVCMGRVSLHDRINKRVDFFTFGGTLEAISIPGETVYWLHSPAPILEITDDSTHVANELASEIQLMLAVFQARWGIDDSGFAQRLEQVEPFECYLGGLGSILMRYQRAPALASSHHKLYTALLGEKAWLTKTGRWPASPLTLGALLLPKSTHRTN